MPAPFVYSNPTVVTFNGQVFESTNMKVDFGGSSAAGGGSSNIDVSTLNLAAGADRVYQGPGLNEVASAAGTTGVLATVTIDFNGLSKPDMASTGHPMDLGGVAKIKGTARCTAYNWDFAVAEIVKGSATFEMITIDASYT